MCQQASHLESIWSGNALCLESKHLGVYERLQKLNLTISHKWMIHLQDVIGKDFDAQVKDWRDAFIPELTAEHEANHSRRGTEQHLLREGDDLEDDISELSSSSSESEDNSDNDSADSDADEDIELLSSVDSDSESEYDDSESDDEAVQHLPPVLQNRIDVSDLPDVLSDGSLPDYGAMALSLLPSSKDDQALRTNISTLISRVLATHLKFFKLTFDDVVEWHMKHEFYQEMSQKSLVVPLGVLLKNENKGDDMVDIMSHLHQYVPSVTYSDERSISTGETVLEQKADIHPILVGGDQLTAARARSAQKVKVNSQTPTKRLSGIVPVAEDWHAKANFLSMIWRYYYSKKSTAEHGTLYQLRNVINRTNVVTKPLKDFNACDDFFVVVIQCHILAAALEMLEMKTVDDVPCNKFVPDGEDTWMQPNDNRKQILDTVSMRIVETFIRLDFNHFEQDAEPHVDNVNFYAKQLLVASIWNTVMQSERVMAIAFSDAGGTCSQCL